MIGWSEGECEITLVGLSRRCFVMTYLLVQILSIGYECATGHNLIQCTLLSGETKLIDVDFTFPGRGRNDRPSGWSSVLLLGVVYTSKTRDPVYRFVFI